MGTGRKGRRMGFHTHQNIQHLHPMSFRQAPAGLWTRCTGSAGSQCPGSVHGSVPPGMPCGQGQVHRRLAQLVRNRAAGTRLVPRAGPKHHPTHGPTRHPGRSPHGHHSDSVRPSASGHGGVLGKKLSCCLSFPSSCLSSSPQVFLSLSPLLSKISSFPHQFSHLPLLPSLPYQPSF